MAKQNQVASRTVRALGTAIEAKVLDVIGELPLNSITAVSLRRVVHGAVTSVMQEAGDVSFVDVTGSSAPGPVRGVKVKQVWDALDKLSARGHIPTLQEIRDVAKSKRWNDNTARVQFYRWRSATGRK